jgi:hypothetical protein
MKKSVIMILSFIFVLSCTNNNKKTVPVNSVKKEALNLAVKYAAGKFREAKETVGKDGTVTITDNQINYIVTEDNRLKYIVDPDKITTGLIDDDNNDDAIVTIFSFRGQYDQMPESLILLKTDGNLVLSRAIESDMKILGIKNRVITAEVYTHSRNSPLHDCSVCKEVVKYQFRMGDLIRIE